MSARILLQELQVPQWHSQCEEEPQDCPASQNQQCYYAEHLQGDGHAHGERCHVQCGEPAIKPELCLQSRKSDLLTRHKMAHNDTPPNVPKSTASQRGAKFSISLQFQTDPPKSGKTP